MKRRAFTLTPANLPPYLQAFLVAMESGAIVLARVLGDGQTDGREKARAAALEACPGGAVWDSAAYPVGPEERAKGPGVDVLKGGQAPAPKTCKDCAFWGRYRKGECDREGGQFSDPATAFEAMARVLDDSGLTTGLVTGLGFSCLHFTARKARKAATPEALARSSADLARAIGPKSKGGAE